MVKHHFPISLVKQRSQLPPKSYDLTPLSNAELDLAIEKIFAWIAAHDKHTKRRPDTYSQSSQSKSYPPISEYFSSPYICRILAHVCTLFKSEPTLLRIDIPTSIPKKIKTENVVPELNICGDIHGSIKELLSIFQRYGLPPRSSYIFLGDYVDRGKHSLSVILILFLLKLRWPSHFYMLRGNHESFVVSSRFGFRREHFPDDTIYGLFNVIFTYMPLAAIVEDHILCCHGGISQWMKSRNSIAAIPRPILFENLSFIEHLIVTDILWADPKPHQIRKFDPSIDRGCGFSFNEAGLNDVLKLLRCNVLVRGHESLKNGIEEIFQSKCYTVHSTALQMGDRAATLCLTKDNRKKIHFEKRYHSYHEVKCLYYTCNNLNSEHAAYKKIISSRIISSKAHLWPILKNLFDPRFHRRNFASEDELYLWVKSNAGLLFAQYVQSNRIRHPRLAALRIFPSMLSIALGENANNTESTPGTTVFLKKFARQCERERRTNSKHRAECLELASSASEDSALDEERRALCTLAKNHKVLKRNINHKINNQIKNGTPVNHKLPVRANLLSVYNSSSDSDLCEKSCKSRRHHRQCRQTPKRYEIKNNQKI